LGRSRNFGLVAGPGAYICERCTSEATLLAAQPDDKPGHTTLTVVPVSQHDTACSFCGKKPTGPDRLVAGPYAIICSRCLVLCREINAGD
jgi:ATP-dependent protease Clp ATPase subunit